MNAILYVWMVVAAGSGGRLYHGWVNTGEYATPAACVSAANQLGMSKDTFRCINKTTGLQ